MPVWLKIDTNIKNTQKIKGATNWIQVFLLPSDAQKSYIWNSVSDRKKTSFKNEMSTSSTFNHPKSYIS